MVIKKSKSAMVLMEEALMAGALSYLIEYGDRNIIHTDRETGKKCISIAVGPQESYVDFLFNDDGSYFDMTIACTDCGSGLPEEIKMQYPEGFWDN
jgi:hypothetical protein